MFSSLFITRSHIHNKYLTMTMEALVLQLSPSYISKIWRIDTGGDKPLLIPRKKLRRPVTSIINKIIRPILAADTSDIERVYYQKIKLFQEQWLNLVQVTDKTHRWKQKTSMNPAFYDRTLKMVRSDPIFANDKPSIIDTIETLKDYETTIQTIFIDNNRLTLLQNASKSEEIDVNDLLYSLYGSYMALVCFWIIARSSRESEKVVYDIAKISHKLAISLDSYNDTLDIMTNPEEMDVMKRAEQWEKQNLKQHQKAIQH